MSNVIKRQIVFERGHQTIVHRTPEQTVDPEPLTTYDDMMHEGQMQLRQQQELLEQREHEQRLALEQERITVLEEARQQGYEKGYRVGQQDGQSSYEQRIDETNQFASRLEQMFSDRIEVMEDELCSLSLQLTHQFLERLHDTDEEALYQSIHKLILQFRDREKLVVYTSADDFERVVLLDDRLQTILGGTATITFRIDAELGARDFRVDSENGAITGGLTSSYDMLMKQLSEVLQDV